MEEQTLVPLAEDGVPISANLLIQGDNLTVLKALQETHGGTIRCIYIDPPYNNHEEYTHYSDDRSHQEWLGALKERIELLRPLLTEDGSLWISIDDGEAHYLKVACDGILGRQSFVATIAWQQRTSRENRRVFSFNHEYVLLYAKDPQRFAEARNDLPLSAEVLQRYRNPDDDPRGPWQSVSANVQAGHATEAQFYDVVAPSGRVHTPPPGRCWAYTKARMQREVSAGNIWFGKNGEGVPRIKKFLRDVDRGLTPSTLWLAEEVGTTRHAKKQLLDMFPEEEPFDTPKPERLIQRILHIATNPGDLVLDAYLGSGTTAAVAHKLGRRYVGIEIGDHALEICAERLKAVIAGEERGISDAVNWKGGGSFTFCRVDGDQLVIAETQP